MAPITLSGFNNIDFKSIVDIIIQSERQPIDRLQTDQKSEQGRLTAYGSLTSSLSRLQDAFSALQTPTAYGDLKATSSDTTILSATASSSASKGSFTINVSSLARPQVTASAGRQFNDINASIIDGGTFSLTQAGVTTSIDLTGVTTLAQLRDAINTQQTGVKASIINDGSTLDAPPKPFRLVLTSADSGSANAFTINDQTTLGGGAPGSVLNLSTNGTSGVAQDTQFDYNGIPIKSTSTTVNGAIPGLTLTLLRSGSANVTVDDDDTSLKSKVTDLVNGFNSFNDFVQGQFKIGASATDRPPLSTDPLLRNLNRQIRSYLTSSQDNAGDIHNLAALGIRLNQSGKLEIDNGALEEALSNDPEGVKTFLAGTSGLAAKVSSAIEAMNGSIVDIESRIKVTIDNYGKRITDMESQLALREDALTRQFAAADEAISQLNSQKNALTNLGNQYRLF
jgi:flagellar hook-associated protein 2